MVMEWAILLWRNCLFRLRLSFIGNLEIFGPKTQPRAWGAFL